jgi:hypothetical protein
VLALADEERSQDEVLVRFVPAKYSEFLQNLFPTSIGCGLESSPFCFTQKDKKGGI